VDSCFVITGPGIAVLGVVITCVSFLKIVKPLPGCVEHVSGIAVRITAVGFEAF
jgi:hypothetical protein